MLSKIPPQHAEISFIAEEARMALSQDSEQKLLRKSTRKSARFEGGPEKLASIIYVTSDTAVFGKICVSSSQ